MKKLKGIKSEDLVFLNIEKARKFSEIEGSEDETMWFHKMSYHKELSEMGAKDSYKYKATDYPEFSKIVCVTLGTIKDGELVTTTYNDLDEKTLLTKLNSDLELFRRKKPKTNICGYCPKKIDMPFIFKRSIINGIRPSELIDVGGFERWHIESVELKELWQGTGFFGASLKEICYSLGLEYQDLEELKDACEISNEKEGVEIITEISEKKLKAVANVLRRFKFEEIFENSFSQAPREIEKESLIERIARIGVISKEDENEILEISKTKNYNQRELLINNLSAALAFSKNELNKDLELQILRG